MQQTSRQFRSDPGRTPAAWTAAGVAFVVVVVALVALSVSGPEPPMYTPTPIQERPAGERLVGPAIVTVDASDGGRWRFFSFARGSVVEDPGHLGWDLAFRRFQIIVNGGTGFAGRGGTLDLGEVPFDSVRALPRDGYIPTLAKGDSVNAALDRWYDYSFTSHLLEPKPRVYAVRTADGRFAKVQFLGYYCPAATPGCVTFRYVFQGAGGRELGSAPGR